MAEVRIVAAPRESFGKGPARQVRRAGNVPAVLYGHGRPPQHLTLPGHDLLLALKGGPNQLLDLRFTGGGNQLALPKAVVRHPIKGYFEHIDLIVIDQGERVEVEVPVVVEGELVGGLRADHDLTTLTMEAPATAIPHEVTVDVTGLDAGDTITAGQVALPDGVTLLTDVDAVVVRVAAAATAEQFEAELAGEAGAAAGDTGESDVSGDIGEE